ncbi:SDR family NAD(P)-dependent oxidoreductase [Orbus mooreae]|uniref:SDR family NAD(P)-dependent oxidoreductase n=1 Tax=Orbus mooreae TaxID=3074107 RepID=UPI00370DA0F7
MKSGVFEKSFFGKLAIVTGGASGIGKSITEILLSLGCNVVVVDFNQDNLDALKLAHHNSKLRTEKLDVTNEEHVNQLINNVKQSNKKIDYAFLVAGISKTGSIYEQNSSDWKATIDVNLISNFYWLKYLGNVMREEKKGSIVVVGSLNSHVPMLGGSAYASSKAGVEMLVKNASIEMAQDGIRVNCILPGLTDTPLTHKIMEDKVKKSEFDRVCPEKRFATVDEIAWPAIFLASDLSCYMNGSSLVVDGGWQNTGYGNIDYRSFVITK